MNKTIPMDELIAFAKDRLGLDLHGQTFADLVGLFDDFSAASTPAAPAVPEGFVLMPFELTSEMRAVIKEVAPRWNADSIYNNLLAAAPAASTTGAAQTAEQVRDQALEEAAKLAIKFTAVPRDLLGPPVGDVKRKAQLGETIAAAIRALKHPTPTHSSEAGDAE